MISFTIFWVNVHLNTLHTRSHNRENISNRKISYFYLVKTKRYNKIEKREM